VFFFFFFFQAEDGIRDRNVTGVQTCALPISRFNAKLLSLWPFGEQVLFCNGDINSVDDLKNKKVRVFTSSMSRLVEGLGATPVRSEERRVGKEVRESLWRGN